MRLRVLGSSADVAHVSITPVPIDRTPAPLPSTVATAMVYSSQPGNACIVDSSNQCTTSGGRVPVIYPNLSEVSPGAPPFVGLRPCRKACKRDPLTSMKN